MSRARRRFDSPLHRLNRHDGTAKLNVGFRPAAAVGMVATCASAELLRAADPALRAIGTAPLDVFNHVGNVPSSIIVGLIAAVASARRFASTGSSSRAGARTAAAGAALVAGMAFNGVGEAWPGSTP